jgi:hypothetical protein
MALFKAMLSGLWSTATRQLARCSLVDMMQDPSVVNPNVLTRGCRQIGEADFSASLRCWRVSSKNDPESFGCADWSN